MGEFKKAKPILWTFTIPSPKAEAAVEKAEEVAKDVPAVETHVPKKRKEF